MKLLKFLFCIVLVTTTSCSSDDNSSNDDDNPSSVQDFFPVNFSNYSKYSIEDTNTITNETIMSNDSLYVVSESATTLALGVNNGDPANGTMNRILVNGQLTKTSTSLSLNGSLELPDTISDLIDFNISLDDVILFDTNATNNSNLSSLSDAIDQDFNGIPITINYTLSTNAIGSGNNLNVNGVAYTDVLSTELVLNVSVMATIDFQGFPFTIAILDPQNILTITNHFANGVGLIKSDALTNYQISVAATSALDAAGIDLGVPSSGSGNNNSDITDFFIVE